MMINMTTITTTTNLIIILLCICIDFFFNNYNVIGSPPPHHHHQDYTNNNNSIIPTQINEKVSLIFNKENDQKQQKKKCFPSLEEDLEFPNFEIVSSSSSTLTTTSSSSFMKDWWCDPQKEYAWLGFSYDVGFFLTPFLQYKKENIFVFDDHSSPSFDKVGSCPTRDEMINTFDWMKKEKRARYVRIYGACDKPTFNQDLIAAAVKSQVGIHALIWFGFKDNDPTWKMRRDRLLEEIEKNPLAPYVFKVVTLGSEPLFDGVLDVKQMAVELKALKAKLAPYGIPITISEMTYAFQINNDAPEIFEIMDTISLNVLPVFDTNADRSNQSWRFINFCIGYGKLHGKNKTGGNNKPVMITQTGWPSNKDEAKDVKAVTNVAEEKAYFDLLDEHCQDFKKEGVGWFSHIYSEATVSGWGIILENGEEKFPFNPLTSC